MTLGLRANGMANYVAVTIVPKEVGRYCVFNPSTPDSQVWRKAGKCYLNLNVRQLDLDVLSGLRTSGGPRAFAYSMKSHCSFIERTLLCRI